MTIKQQGGVFGRNPTFNDVDVEGTLTVGGSAIPSPADTLTSSDIGSTVQGFDADTAKTDTAQTFTAKQDVTFAGGGNYIATFQNTTSATPYGVQIKDAASGAAGYPLLNISNSAGSTEYFKVNSGTNPNIVVGKNLAMANGNGIDFSATAGTGTSELFDDYEEGTWTPTLVGASSAGTYSIAASGCTYTKVGRLVTVMGKMTITVSSAGSGSAQFGGLPFTTSGDAVAIGTAISKNVDLDNSTVSLALQPWTSDTNLFAIVSVRDNSTTATLDVSGISTGDFIIINTTYIT